MDQREVHNRPDRHARSQSRRRWTYAIVGLVVVAGVAAAIFLTTVPRSRSQVDALSSDESPERQVVAVGPRAGQLAPDFTLLSLAGEPITLSAFRGRVVILDFWASWCVPCRLTLPKLHQLWQGFASRDVVMIGVSLDRNEADAVKYLEETRLDDMIAVWESRSASSRVASRYAVSGIPHTLVIDPDGIVQFNGHPTRLTTERIEQILE
ncbi:TlpA family protein disulfide reductase [Candidatus Bipolaricaulota bacterium]